MKEDIAMLDNRDACYLGANEAFASVAEGYGDRLSSEQWSRVRETISLLESRPDDEIAVVLLLAMLKLGRRVHLKARREIAKPGHEHPAEQRTGEV